MKVMKKENGQVWYAKENYHEYTFGGEAMVILGNPDKERDAEFEAKFEALNEVYNKLAALGIAPLMNSLIGSRHETVDRLMTVWSKVAEMATEDWSVSPYGDSWYSSKEISLEYKPEGSLRIADHWNFTTRDGKLHCRTTDGQFDGQWAIGRFSKGRYEIIEVIG